MKSEYKLTMCRLCLCENQCFFYIFDRNDWHGYIAAEVISNLLQFQVSETDSYPHVVCSTCLTKLTDFKLFKECCEKSRVEYDNMFVSMKNLEENNPEIDIADGGSRLELCEQDPLGETSSDLTLKSEEVMIDPCSYEDSEDPLIETEVSCGPILLKYEVLPFSRDSHSQDNIDPLNLEPEEGDINSTKDISIGKEVENKIGNIENDLGGDVEAQRETGQEKGARERREELECFHCGIVLTSKVALLRHMKVHGFVNSYVCPECGKVFRFNCQFKMHLLTHTGSKPYKCAECSKHFSKKCNLQRHMRLHTGSKPYKCAVCSKSFNQSFSLKTHMRLHTGSKPYKCVECSKSFSDSSNLKKHMRIHTGFKPYKCPGCSKSFNQSSSLNTHIRVHRL